MFVKYTPENPADGDPQEWTFEPGRVRATEGQVILREFGQKSWDVFVNGVKSNDLHARRVLLWHLLRRQHPLMKFADTPDFYADEFEIEFSSVELTQIRDGVEKASQAELPANKEMMLAALDEEIAAVLKREADMGKALSGPISSPE